MKRFLSDINLFFVFLILAFPSLAHAQANQVTLTSYYPAPFGAYDRLRLVPRPPIATCSSNDLGTLYIPNTTNVINQCQNPGPAWVPLTGGEWVKASTNVNNPGKFGTNAPIDQYTLLTTYPNGSGSRPNVGIGTTDPRRPLHIAVDSLGVESLLVLENTNPRVGNGTGISFRGVDTSGVNNNISFTQIASIEARYGLTGIRKNSALEFKVLNGLTGQEILIFNLSGVNGAAVGLHTRTPSGWLEIAGEPGTPSDYLQITDNDTANLTSGNIFIVDAFGNVGINQRIPTERLDVNGNIKATALILTSDATLKQNFVPVTNALEKISRLNGVSFEWKNDAHQADQRKHMGVLAQDVEKVFPESVYGKEGAKGVDYPSLIAPLIEAVKELKTKNDTLTQELSRQSALIHNQEEQIKSLENSFGQKESPLTP